MTPCTDTTDVLLAGTAIILQQPVPTVNRSVFDLYFDGGDRVGASFPIAMTRAAFPVVPGSRMAGAVEVLSQDAWGIHYEAPVGTDVAYVTSAFQYVDLFVMSSRNGNLVTYQTGANPATYTTVTLDMGDSIAISVKQSWTVVGTKPLQVDLITGDIGSTYELRWFSLLPTNAWAQNYLTPVGDSKGKTKVVVYNPGNATILVSYDYLLSNGMTTTATFSVAAKKDAMTNVIPTGSAAQIYSDNVFFAFSFTDTAKFDGSGQRTFGQAYDWGFPLQPYDLLSPQVLIGLGYGCTYDHCNSTTRHIMSVVWVSPTQNADIYVDFDNNGVVDKHFPLDRLHSHILRNTNDTDMSGAFIFATARDSGPSGTPVNLAAAWGQDPELVSLSVDDQDRSLDLGTVVLPLPTIRISKSVSLLEDTNGGMIRPSDVVRYTIRVTNVGLLNIPPGQVLIVDNGLDSQLTYIPNSTYYNTEGGFHQMVVDDITGATAFSLDEGGITNLATLSKRGGQHEIVFDAQVKPRSELV